MSDDRQDPPPGEHDDRTRPFPRPGGPAPDDRTQRLPGAADRAPSTTPDATRPMPVDRDAPADRTAPLPSERPASAAWSGRAEVPPPRPADQPGAGTEWYAGEPSGRRWWLPILWGVVVLLLLGLLGAGLWLALRSAEDDGTGPAPSTSPSASPARTSASPSTAAPTSATPTTSSPAPPTTSAPARVPVPPVANLPLDTARAILDDLGLEPRVEYRDSDRPPGTVISTEPGAGELVAEGGEVTLVVSRPESSPTSDAPSPSAAVTTSAG